MELKGQLAIVTGAGRGIGAAIGKRLASMGATVVLAARDLDQLSGVQREIEAHGGSARAAQLDLLDEQSIAKLAQSIGRCDILVNNAAIGGIGRPLHEMPPADFDRLTATNLRAPYLMIRAFAPMMIAAKSGHIINISSLAGHGPLPGGAAYSASKWGLNGLTYSVEGRPDGKDPNKKIQPDDVARVVAMLVTQSPQSFVSEVLLRPTQKP